MPEEQSPLEAVPWRPVAAICAGIFTLLMAVSTRYGWHRDELYFLEAGRHHLAWGYVDQPPFTPFIARLADQIAPGNLAVLRLLPALTAVATIVLGTLIARELGARRSGQIVACGSMAAGGFALGVGHILSTAAFDLTAWMALLWIAVRLMRTQQTRWWLAFGAIAGAALLNKSLVVMLAVALLIGLVVERRWALLRSPWLVAGGGLALLIAAPNLLWQADHGWPQREMAEALSRRLGTENRTTLIPLQLLFAGPLFVPVLWSGAKALATSGWARLYRPLLWTWIAGVVIAFVTAGRPYYVLPLTTVVLLVGFVDWAQRGRARTLAWILVPSAAMTIVLAVPVLPVSAVNVTATVNEAVAETVGWPELVDQVAGVVRSLPPEEQDHVVLLTLTYGEAGAIDRFGPARGLPHAYSGHNSYADFRQPTDPAAVVVGVIFRPERLAPFFDRCEVVAHIDNGKDVDNDDQGEPITLCHGLHTPWPTVWEQLRRLS
jgi:4-amino-4-deoxy-L-arabinose transferase-like glycosyltransferase